MKVRVYDYVEGHECFRSTADLVDAIPDRAERAKAEFYLTASGRYWCGGGAAPLVLLMVTHD